MKKNSGYEIVFEGMKKYLLGMKKKPIFANFPFHTLGYENIGCFFLMTVFGCDNTFHAYRMAVTWFTAGSTFFPGGALRVEGRTPRVVCQRRMASSGGSPCAA